MILKRVLLYLRKLAALPKYVLVPLGVGLLGIVVMSASAQQVPAVPFAVCPAQTIMTKDQRVAAGIPYWPDGTMGIVKEQTQYSFVAANSVKPATTMGTLNNPIANGVRSNAAIQNLKQPYDYAAGGPVYKDTASRWLMFYHSERWLNGDPKTFYSSVGMAISADKGKTWRDLGEIIRSHIPYGATSYPIEIGGGPYVRNGDYLYVYFKDHYPPEHTTQISVARASVAEIVAASKKGTVAMWHNYFEGTWLQPSQGGLSSSLEEGNNNGRQLDVAFSKTLNQYVLVVVANDAQGEGRNLHLMFSPDGLNWSARQPVTSGPAESFYPSLVSLGSNPKLLGGEFYVYYTEASPGGWGRWDNANLVRRSIKTSGTCPQT